MTLFYATLVQDFDQALPYEGVKTFTLNVNIVQFYTTGSDSPRSFVGEASYAENL